jgi:hypothetical protein
MNLTCHEVLMSHRTPATGWRGARPDRRNPLGGNFNGPGEIGSPVGLVSTWKLWGDLATSVRNCKTVVGFVDKAMLRNG